ncbi:hypothetical protein C0Q70_10941 [Pomacea canaliculata]|uniref:Uncharacterized protein n=1 Tax=Pomacea canaliculata TaxID=400727 RepID=A0A2T7P4K6_POMCA|nr:hypothetical protein C0Q70_10941 [Pomacea canaliculata]
MSSSDNLTSISTTPTTTLASSVETTQYTAVTAAGSDNDKIIGICVESSALSSLFHKSVGVLEFRYIRIKVLVRNPATCYLANTTSCLTNPNPHFVWQNFE